jgi:molybdopterin adenylyltransferase
MKAEVEAYLQEIEFRAVVITLSDRASKGEYNDTGGPLIMVTLQSYFQERKLKLTIVYELIADDQELFKATLQKYIQQDYHFIFSTGSTGIGPRDIAPDVVKPLLTKEIPGIMELIRVKYGTTNPNAALSRSVAGVSHKTLIYTLPGNPKAVKEYLEEISKTLIHCFLMLNAVDEH